MHRLSSSFVLGYHGCDREVGERLLGGEDFKPSDNDYDWLGPGIYFWENNWARGFEFASEQMKRKESKIVNPFVVGAVIDLGACLDLTTKASIDLVRVAYNVLTMDFEKSGTPFPKNDVPRRKHYLDCAVIKRVHRLANRSEEIGAIQSVKGVFVGEGGRVYPGSEFYAKTHIQIAVCDLACIKAVFRVREMNDRTLRRRRRFAIDNQLVCRWARPAHRKFRYLGRLEAVGEVTGAGGVGGAPGTGAFAPSLEPAGPLPPPALALRVLA